MLQSGGEVRDWAHSPDPDLQAEEQKKLERAKKKAMEAAEKACSGLQLGQFLILVWTLQPQPEQQGS